MKNYAKTSEENKTKCAERNKLQDCYITTYITVILQMLLKKLVLMSVTISSFLVFVRSKFFLGIFSSRHCRF